MDSLVLCYSCQSSKRSLGRPSRIPSRKNTFCSWGLKLAHVGSFFAFFRVLLRLLSLLARFSASWGAPGLILEGSGGSGESFGASGRVFFDVFVYVQQYAGVSNPMSVLDVTTRSFLEL